MTLVESKSHNLIVPLAEPAATTCSGKSKATDSIVVACPPRLYFRLELNYKKIFFYKFTKTGSV